MSLQGSRAAQKGSNPDNTFDHIFPGPSQKITTSGSSQQTSAFQTHASVVRVYCTQDCYIAIGANPTATPSTLFLPASTVERFGITSGDKLAVIQATASGTLYVTEGLV